MLIRNGEVSEKAQQELLKSRYGHGYFDLMLNCLERAEGIAGLISHVSSLGTLEGVNNGTSSVNIYQAASVLEQEIKDAKVILNDFYKCADSEFKYNKRVIELANEMIQNTIEGN